MDDHFAGSLVAHGGTPSNHPSDVVVGAGVMVSAMMGATSAATVARVNRILTWLSFFFQQKKNSQAFWIFRLVDDLIVAGGCGLKKQRSSALAMGYICINVGAISTTARIDATRPPSNTLDARHTRPLDPWHAFVAYTMPRRETMSGGVPRGLA